MFYCLKCWLLVLCNHKRMSSVNFGGKTFLPENVRMN